MEEITYLATGGLSGGLLGTSHCEDREMFEYECTSVEIECWMRKKKKKSERWIGKVDPYI